MEAINEAYSIEIDERRKELRKLTHRLEVLTNTRPKGWLVERKQILEDIGICRAEYIALMGNIRKNFVE